ncbi:phage tail P2-like protein [Vogesella perlucida]|nr:phage tail P2-like protein [Vogesella perlucida]
MADRLQQTAVPNVLANDPRFGPLATLTERLGQLDLSTLLVYLVDLVGADLLPVLAEQMHVMGDEGWLLANTDDQRRTLIKRAVELHRYKGTVWAVKEVFGVLAVDVELVEWWQQQPTAAPYTFALTAWVNSNLLPGAPVLTAELYERLQRMVDMVKPVRSSFDFKVGVRLDQPTWSLANAQQAAAVGRWAGDAQAVQPTPDEQPVRLASTVATTATCRNAAEPQAVQPTPAVQPLRAANAQQAQAVARCSAEPQPVQPAPATNPVRLACVARPLSVLRVSMEVQ